MSHHLDTPEAARSGQLFIDDLYLFDGVESTVFVMDVNSDITGVRAEPGFHPEARYEFRVHFDGAAEEALTFRVAFGPADADGRQGTRLYALSGADAVGDSSDGELLLTGRTGEAAQVGEVRLWAGHARDSFYIDLSLLGIVNAAVAEGTAVELSQWDSGTARNTFTGTTVQSIVLEVSHAHPRLRPGARLGVWCATKLATDAGGWRQINRAGHPMMWPIFWPGDTDFTNPANTRHPSRDAADDAEHIAGLVTAVVSATGSSTAPAAYGAAVAAELFPDVLSYVVGTPATYGFATLNGRNLADNAPEVMLSLVAGTAVPSGLAAAVSAAQRAPEFPYVVPT